MDYLIGVDIGTYSSKGVLIDLSGRIVAHAETPHKLSIPRHGWAEHDADAVWWSDLVALCRRLVGASGAAPGSIAALGVSAIAPCVLPVDRAAKPLRPAILYGVDTRAVEEIELLTAELGAERILEHSGSELSAQSAGPKILWLRRNEPDVYRAATSFLTSTSYLVLRLTGETVIDHYTAAFCGPLFDIHERRWDEGAARPICDLTQLAEPRWTTEIAGRITAQAAAETGLAEGTPVTVGTADAAAEAIAAGVTAPGDVMLMYGSSMFLIAVTDVLARGGVFWPAPYLFPGANALAAGMATTGSITEWFRSELSPNVGFEELARGAASVAPGSEGLLVLPYFSGERTPLNDPKARGIVAGLSLKHGRAHLYRAILEGVAYGIRHNFEAMASVGAAQTRVVAIGGGTKNPSWLQIVSDVTGLRQEACESGGACYGDAILAGIGVGALAGPSVAREWSAPGAAIEPDPARHERYARYYELFRELYRATAETAHALAELAG